ncbi:tripartite tricarboxylate transporter substrate binding protein (plasmid) [Cupriavidus necator]|uniref:Tripartite tricarboxylate transporter substrate binding protein n=1 Tax=Cupriavidus necator TaxID=106590 RepID=A0A367P956_CUPNE|nr:tripartite tricarboxylate transporter substrate binding protein [Cupriavidus necator]QQX89547.1 tripartite tricarboxylate transporter substrate binding protein [Cupriavidus necator]RCJ04094.1 tripartite tricarboxylate transporter substrate binding protein [Cupriavidus necator]
MMYIKRKLAILSTAAFWFISCNAGAQDQFPSRPIKLVVPNVPGGGSDVIARAVAQRLAPLLGQAVVVENRSGGAENIGIDFVAKSAGDGYTLLYASNSLTIKPSLYKGLPYNVENDLQPLGNVITDRMYIVAGMNAPFKTLAELQKYAKEHPGKLAYGTPGTGTPHHLAMELYKSTAGLDIVHVPYRGTGPGVTDLIGGSIPLLISTSSPVVGYVKTGKVRPIAIFDDKRSSSYRDVPAISETSPGVKVVIWQGFFVPKGVPTADSAKLTEALKAVANDAGFIKQMNELNITATWTPPDTVRSMVKAEIAQWARVVKEAGIQAE